MGEFFFGNWPPDSSSNGSGDEPLGGAQRNNYEPFATCSQRPTFQADKNFNISRSQPCQPTNRARPMFRTPFRPTNPVAPPTQPRFNSTFRPPLVTRTTAQLAPTTITTTSTTTSNNSNNASQPVFPVFVRQQPTRPPSREPVRDPTPTTVATFPTSTLLRPLDPSSQQIRPAQAATSGDGTKHNLRAVTEIPEQYQSVFKTFPYFNIVQSKVLDDVLHSDKSVVVSAPTGSGKTVVFELAIIRLLNTVAAANDNYKIIYMAPIKALCSERFEDWKEKFQKFGVRCAELTGDTEVESYNHFQNINMIFTTPEKWDSTTRRWRDNRYLVKLVKLFLIDEIHILNDPCRGATVEAVISRMLTLHMTNSSDRGARPERESVLKPDSGTGIRFLAVSATIPNTQDFADWLGSVGNQSISHKLGEDLRPVKLTRVVIGYPFYPKWTDFKFDMSLSYKVSDVIEKHAHGKPTLIFCSTRKGVVQTCGILTKEGKVRVPVQLRLKLQTQECVLRDEKLKESVLKGVGYHHAGLDHNDRRVIEHLFLHGDLPVLTATSTLAMGVNLPAHLVIIKSTVSYVAGNVLEYSDSQILQMIGRAGRPQFDTEATAVIMTKQNLKNKYTNFLNGTEQIESSLHTNLAEYLNAEIVLQTITDMPLAMQWIKSTFLYVRVAKKPKHYGIPEGLTVRQTEQKLQEMCKEALNSLVAAQLIEMDDNGFCLKATEAGRLMARYCVSLDTMKKFKELDNIETIQELITMIASCKELSDVQLRTSEKKDLNTMNKDKHLQTIRFPLEGKIKTREMKTNCLIQAVFGCITIQDFTLNQETTRIMKIGQRLAKCLSEYVIGRNKFKEYVSCVLLAKCFHAKLWENSNYVAKQIEKIGITMSHALVNSGLTTFQKIVDTNPRQLELLVNRHAPFGNHIRKAIAVLPKYDILVEQTSKHSEDKADINLTVELKSYDDVQEVDATTSGNFPAMLVVGDRDNNVLFKQRLVKSSFGENQKWHKLVKVTRATKGVELTIKMISEQYVGLDVEKKFSPVYLGGNRANSGNKRLLFTKPDPKQVSRPSHAEEDYDDLDELPDIFSIPTKKSDAPASQQVAATPGILQPNRRKCSHKCSNKSSCAHECCKTGVTVKTTGAGKTPNATTTAEKISRNAIACFTSELHKKMNDLPSVECMSKLPWKNNSRVKPSGPGMLGFKKFAYVKPRQFTPDLSATETNQSTQSAAEPDPQLKSSTTSSSLAAACIARPGGTWKGILDRPNFDLLSSQEDWSDLSDSEAATKVSTEVATKVSTEVATKVSTDVATEIATEDTAEVEAPAAKFSPPLVNSSHIDEDDDLIWEELTEEDYDDLPNKMPLPPPPVTIPRSPTTNKVGNVSDRRQGLDLAFKLTAGPSTVQTFIKKMEASRSSVNRIWSDIIEVERGDGDASDFHDSPLIDHSSFMEVDLTAEDFQSSPKQSPADRAGPTAGLAKLSTLPKYSPAFPWSSAPPLVSTKWSGHASKQVNNSDASTFTNFMSKPPAHADFVSAKSVYLSEPNRKRMLDEGEFKSGHGDYKRPATVGRPTLSMFQQHQLQMPKNMQKTKLAPITPEYPVPIMPTESQDIETYWPSESQIKRAETTAEETEFGLSQGSISLRIKDSICESPKPSAPVPRISSLPVQEPISPSKYSPWTLETFKFPVSQQAAPKHNMVEINEALDALRNILGED